MNAPSIDVSRAGLRRALTGRSVPILLAFIGWTLLAAIPTTSAFIVARGGDAALWWRFFKPLVTYYYAWALVTPLIYVMVDRLTLSGSRAPWTILAHLALLTGFSITATLLHGDDWREWLYGRHALGYHTMSVFSYALALLACIALRGHRLGLAREREAAEMRLRAAMLDGRLSAARIDALRSQINPHFLFNALNSIAALIESGRNDEGYRTTELLGQLLRTALSDARKVDVSLAEELEFIDTYVAIEKIRFGPRLEFSAHIDPATRMVSIPALLLQPLVENAVKHAVARLERTVRIVVTAQRNADLLRIDVRDDGPGFSPVIDTSAPDRCGLRNVQERLGLRYAGRARLDILAPRAGGTCVTLRLPMTD